MNSFENVLLWNNPYDHFLQLGASGEIFIAGSSLRRGVRTYAVVKHLPTGEMDSTFGDEGIAQVVASDRSDDVLRDFVMSSDGALVALGSAGREVCAAIKLRPDGTLDEAFADAGILRVQQTFGLPIVPESLVVDDEGRLTFHHFDRGIYLRRYLGDGQLDPEFGDGGIQFIDWRTEGASCLQLDALGRFYLAIGSFFNQRHVYRLTADGQSDPTFGDDGLAVVDVDSGTSIGLCLTLQPDGKVILAYGFSGGMPNSHVDVVRLLENGDRDPSFAGGDRSRIVVPGDETLLRSVVAGPSEIMIGVSAEIGSTEARQGLVVRLTQDGLHDLAFGQAGLAQVLEGGEVFIDCLNVQSDGKIVVSGSRHTTRPLPEWLFPVDGTPGIVVPLPPSETLDPILNEAVVTRLLPNGEKDVFFGQAGEVAFENEPRGKYDSEDLPVLSAVQQSGDIIVAATDQRSVLNARDFVFRRYEGVFGSQVGDLEDWKALHFGAMKDSDAALNLGDFDSDGLSNLLEFLMGLDPVRYSNMMEISSIGDHFEWRYLRSLAASDAVNYQVQWTHDLAMPVWRTDMLTSEQVFIHDGVMSEERVRLNAPGSRCFFRITVELNE